MGTLGSHDDQDAFCQHDFLWLGFDKNPYNHQLLQRPPKTSRVDPAWTLSFGVGVMWLKRTTDSCQSGLE